MAERKHPMAVAMEWVARVFASAVMMCAPGIGGYWLDRWLGTQFLALLGFAVGLVGAMAYLIAVTKAADRKRREARRIVHDDEGVDEFR